MRRYVVLIAKSHRCKWSPLRRLFAEIQIQRVTPGRVLFVNNRCSGVELTVGEEKQLKAYLDRFGDEPSNLYDLGQSALKRPRASRFPRPCMTLTTSSRTIYCPGEGRALSPSELLMAQGFPGLSFGVNGISDGFICFPEWSSGALVRLAGNAMCAPCVGMILWWISQHAFPSHRDRPGKLLLSSLSHGRADGTTGVTVADKRQAKDIRRPVQVGAGS